MKTTQAKTLAKKVIRSERSEDLKLKRIKPKKGPEITR
jgi:hypothetical protein